MILIHAFKNMVPNVRRIFGTVKMVFQINQRILRKMFGMNKTKFPITLMKYGKMYWNGKKFQISSTIGCAIAMSNMLIYQINNYKKHIN